jgi:PBP1b-binding outer membrane lipoprotein LpoB
MKKTFLMTATIVAILITSSCSNKKSSDTKADSTDAPVNNNYKGIDTPVTGVSHPTKPAESAPSDIVITKKDTAKAGNFVFMVKNITIPTEEMENLATKPKDDEKYIAVQIWLKNISQSDVSLTRDEFKLFDQDDAEYAEIANLMLDHRKKPILFEANYDPIVLKPNQSKSGWVTFTTAKNSTATKIQYGNITVKL